MGITKQQREQFKELARLKYINEGKTYIEIADALGVSRQTIGKWADEGKWEEYRISISLTQEESLKSTYRMLDDLNKAIEARPEGQRYPTSKESSIRASLTADIAKLQTDVGIQEAISVCSKLLSWVRQSDMEEAKRLATILDSFVKTLL
ncbi:MAG: DDE transposase family protein [Porphyromonas sp.]|nr:DDE transposase family protein [Porphyromonas sp.]